MTWTIAVVQHPIVYQFFWPFPLLDICHMLQNFCLKSGIHCLSYRDRHLSSKLSKKRSACPPVTFTGLISHLRLRAKTQDLFPVIIFDKRSASCVDHSKSS